MENLKGQADREFLAWLAGFWEGEGSLEATTRHSRISIAQCNPVPLRFIQEKLGLGYVGISERRRKPHYNDKWVWEVGRRSNVIKIVDTILPYLRFKREVVLEKLSILKQREAENPINPWYTKEENEFLVKNFTKMTPKQIAKKIGRSRQSVSSRSIKLGLVNPRKRGGQPKNQTPSEKTRLRWG